MKALEDKILAEGQVYPGNILKVSSFLNHQLDVDFLMSMGEERKLFPYLSNFNDCDINLIKIDNKKEKTNLSM